MLDTIKFGNLIGEGAYGKVYEALNEQGGLVAVKIIQISQQNRLVRDKLLNEIILLKNLKHDNVIQYLDSKINNDSIQLVMEFMPGGSLSQMLKDYGPMDEHIISIYTKQLLEGLIYLHENNVIHSDLKAANILFDGRQKVKLSDFGAAHVISKEALKDKNKAKESTIKGSLFWMAPEMILQTGDYNQEADIWSLGCTMIEMATGKHPWGKQVQNYPVIVINMSIYNRPEIPEFLSDYCKDFIDQCLQFDQNLRPTPQKLLNHPFILYHTEN